ncbi:MAG TPA: DUF4175 domain-containing protein [Polyangiaceae bacterium]|nr:DUF4175 domain-containing protein [Polyangiaceae bacterium]
MLSATQPLFELGKSWRSVTRPARRRLAVALVVSAGVLALLGARHGTVGARAVGAATIVAALAFLVGWRQLGRARLGDPERVLKSLVGPVDPQGAQRALRALALRAPGAGSARDGTSESLARIHVERSLARLPSREALAHASRMAARVGVGATIVAACALGAGLANGWSILEGADVLLARHGVAPVSMTWIDVSEILARPPDYLHRPEIDEPTASAAPLVLPYGTTITIRGAAARPGRTLLLSDGSADAPFVDDGSGSVVSRWKLTGSRTLRVVARFGDVVIPQSSVFDVVSIADDAPIVHLEGAPRQLRLVDAVEDIPIRFDAADDHGLREVHLVLRSGVREDRRVLARLDGETRSFSGGSVVKLRDGFLAKSHAPVTIVVEAKDNDPLTGPKWGASEAIVVIPPDVGEPQAMRLDALRRCRDAFVDTLAWRLASDRGGEDGSSPRDIEKKRRAIAVESGKRADDDTRLLAGALAQVYGGVRVPPRVRSVLLGQQRQMRKAVEAEVQGPFESAHPTAIKATERFVLVTDAVVRGLGESDTRTSALQLADVADDMAEAARQMQEEGSATEARARAAARMAAADAVLAAGGAVMRRFGATGRDLGEIVGADLIRVRRATDARDLAHAELAARDLAARLRQPDPSFDTRGGVDRGGGESGGMQGASEDDSDALDDVEQAFEEALQDLDRLAQDHAGEIAKVERAMAGASDDAETKRFLEEARRHARAVRDAARQLPTVGMGSDSWTSKGAAARELAEQMARALEDGRQDEAAESGRSAVGSLEEAIRMLQRGGWFEDPHGQRQREAEDARRRLENESEWIEQQRAELRKRASERARAPLEQDGEDEDRLAERARLLAQRGRNQASFPEQAVESIDQAQRAAREAAGLLKQGDGDRGLDKQREAQRALEAAHEEMQGEEGASGSGDADSARLSSRDPVAIPDASEHKGPAEFRDRVMRGLAQPASPLLKDAVKRYAEGLLR